MNKIDLKQIDWKRLFPEELEKEIVSLSLAPYRAVQLFQWIHQKGIERLEAAANLPKADIEKLRQLGDLTGLEALEEQVSKVDGSVKYLFALSDGEQIEAVVIPAEDRKTLCLSSQVGCAYGCVFCATGLMGFKRNLTASEIVEQFYEVRRRGHVITNLVFMGMGEPLANYDEVLRAIRLLNHPEGAHVGARRITISTVGLAPRIRDLAQEGLQVNLAVSLSATTNRLRSQLMPVNQKYPLEAVIQHAREYAVLTRRRVSFEYVLLAGINDSLEDAKRLAKWLSGFLSHLNVIPYNPVEGLPYQRPDPAREKAFCDVLEKAGVPISVRESGGPDIQAACGQLRTSFHTAKT